MRHTVVVPAKAGTDTPRLHVISSLFDDFAQRLWLWVPAFAGTTLPDGQITRRTCSDSLICPSLDSKIFRFALTPNQI